MRRPPPANAWLNFPVTSVAIVLALFVTILWWGNGEAAWAFMDARTWKGQLWRPLTSIFPHVDFVHLIFNVYWIWVFGTLLEGTYGRLRYLGILALFAFGSSTAQYAFSVSGVGLSGVGYGLFGLLWVLSRRDERFYEAIDGQTIALFLGWFFMCILLTHSGIWQVGNVAHGAGAVQGLLLGLAVTSYQGRVIWAALSGALPVLFVIAAAVCQPDVNFSDEGRKIHAEWLAFEAYEQQTAGEHERAIALYVEALRVTTNDARSWYNLGISYQHLGQMNDARKAYQRAVDIRPNDEVYRAALLALRNGQ